MGLVLVVLNRIAGLLCSVLLVWAAWTHRISAIQPWLLSTIVVGAAVVFFVLSVATPRLVIGFLTTIPLGLGAAALVAVATAQWFPAVALAIGAALAIRVIRGARALLRHGSNTQLPSPRSE